MGYAGLPESITGWIKAVSSAIELSVEQRAGGASRLGYAVDAQRADGSVYKLWLRMDSGHGPQSGGTYTLRREAAVYRALASTPVKVAPIVAVHPTEECFLMERLEGRNWFSEIRDPAQQQALATAFMQQLAALHKVDARTLDLPELGPVRDVAAHVVEELDIWDQQYRAQDPPDALIALALRWLRRNLPAGAEWPVVLVQGDTGPGNFMFDGTDIVAITDWEMAHWGDLHDDLAWVYVRDLQERFSDLPARVRDYERFSGRTVDIERLKYFLVLAQARCAIGTRNGWLSRDSRGEMANHLIYNTMHMRLLGEALADAFGAPFVANVPENHGQSVKIGPAMAAGNPAGHDGAAGDDGGEGWVFGVILDDLRDYVVPNVAGSMPTRKAKGLVRLVKYLERVNTIGPALRDEELRELSDLLGASPGDVERGRAQLCSSIDAGSLDERAVLRYCLRQMQRLTELARPAMGSLAERHYSPLP